MRADVFGGLWDGDVGPFQARFGRTFCGRAGSGMSARFKVSSSIRANVFRRAREGCRPVSSSIRADVLRARGPPECVDSGERFGGPAESGWHETRAAMPPTRTRSPRSPRIAGSEASMAERGPRLPPPCPGDLYRPRTSPGRRDWDASGPHLLRHRRRSIRTRVCLQRVGSAPLQR
jgi:hypothetical protein